MLAAAYCRVSSQEQQRRGTIESQRRILLALAATQGHELYATYEDDGRSAKAGALEHRDGWARLMRDATARRFDVLLVVDIDRITRTSDMQERGAILGPFQRLGIHIVTPQGALDLNTLTGDMMSGLYAVFAAEERRKLLARCAAGRRTATLRGQLPNGPAPYGLRWSKVTGWLVCEPEAEVIREIHRRIARGESCATIGLDLDRRGIKPSRAAAWSQFNVWHLIRYSRTRYAGSFLAHKRDGLSVPVPAIVTLEEIEAAEAQLANNQRRGLTHRTTAVYLLDRGQLRCKQCGDVMGVDTAKATAHARYVCTRRKLRVGHPDRCDLPTVRVADLDGALWAEVADVVAEPRFMRMALERFRQWKGLGQNGQEVRARHARAEIERLRQVEAVVTSHAIAGRLSAEALSARLTGLASEIAQHEVTLREAPRSDGVPVVSEDDVAEAIADLQVRVASAEGEERRTWTRKLVRRAILTGRGVLRFGVALPVCTIPYYRTDRGDADYRVLVQAGRTVAPPRRMA